MKGVNKITNIENLTGVKLWLSRYTLSSKGTQDSYRTKLSVFFSVCKIYNDNELLHFGNENLQYFYDYVQKYKWSHNYIMNNLVTIKLLFSWLKSHSYIKENVLEDIKIAVDKKNVLYTPTIEEVDRLLTTIKNHTKKQRTYVITRLFLASGLRRSALFNAKISDLGLNYIRVTEKGNKIKNQPVPLSVIDEIKHYINTERKEIVDQFIAEGKKDEGYIFVSSFQDKNANTLKMAESLYIRTLKKMARKAGIARWDEITCHALRRTYGTTILKETNNLALASKLLGHSSVQVTADHYIGIAQEELETTAMEYNPISVLSKANCITEDKTDLIKQLLSQQQAINASLKKLGII